MKGRFAGVFFILTIFSLLSLFLISGAKPTVPIEELPLEGFVSQPAFSPKDTNSIACFVSLKEKTQIILLDLSRSRKQGKTLFSSSESGVYPNLSYGIHWSPQGEYLLFLANSTPKPVSLVPVGAIWLISIPSGKARAITKGEDLFSPAFSPDGKFIAALQGTPSLANLWIYDVSRNKWEKMLEGLKANCLTWEKGGRKIYVGGDEGIYEVNLDSSKPDARFHPHSKHIVSLSSFVEGALIATVLSKDAFFSPDLLPIRGADIEMLAITDGELKEVQITTNGASHLPVVSQKGLLLYIKNIPLLDDGGVLRGVISTIWEASKGEVIVPYCDGDSKLSISPDSKLLAFTREGKLCIANIERFASAFEVGEAEDKELAEKVNWMKQIGLAIMMYCQDWDENWPLAENLEEGLFPYLKNENLKSILSDPHFHYQTLPPLAYLSSPSQTVLAIWEVSPDVLIELYADGHVALFKKNEKGGE
ncbi:PD40 domain-containing protein, partial [bacterium]|nr:PD40 domain-containing protein [bacterium]